jgi:hypothetical protein
MNTTQQTFEALWPLLFFVLMVCVVIGFTLTSRFHRLLRERHPEVYDSLGRPTLFLNNSVQNGWASLRFILGGHFQTLGDPEVVRLCRLIRIFFFCYTLFFIALVVFGFASTSSDARP